jgi:NitT/TauT family transport system substrate-binding protein
MSRRAIGIAVFLSCALVACSAPAPSTAPAATRGPATAPTPTVAANLVFQLDWIPNIQHFGPVYADQKGLYKAAGLNVTVRAGGQGIDGLQMVAAGAADVAVNSATSVYVANEHGLDVVGFAAVYQKSASALVCRGDRGITNFTDIKGKTIGSKGPSDLDTLPVLLAKNGVEYSSVKVTPIGPSSITEIIAGLVDCQLAFAVNEPITMRKAGITPVVFNLADYGCQGEVYITRQSFLDQHADVLVRFLQATASAWATYLDDPQAAAQWIVDSKIVDGLDAEQQKAQAVDQAGLIADDFSKQHGLMALNPSLWQEQAQQALDAGRISQPPDFGKASTLQILDAAALPKR